MAEHPERELRHILGYIGAVRDAMRMQNWDITLHREMGSEEDVHAETWCNPNHYLINIRLGPGFFGVSSECKRNTIGHELVHAQHRDVSELWAACTLNNSSVAASDARAWDSDFHMFMERFVAWTTLWVAAALPTYDRSCRYGAHVGVDLVGEGWAG